MYFPSGPMPSSGVISQTIPDGSVLGYTYDANGNLIALTPPGRPAHTFAYTPVGRRATTGRRGQ